LTFKSYLEKHRFSLHVWSSYFDFLFSNIATFSLAFFQQTVAELIGEIQL